ncbi:meiotic recombination rec12 [Trichoderma arundinaceum]|uniref:DNA topoisomerase (ATP-hydrolyzing) n=1 Tax=Trichoderma arundinaceum TaxID=490622 RepID=A0A395NTF0_TRIAR|nr:meiotic recombination rec12 [Trichoderma arundinaceum]
MTSAGAVISRMESILETILDCISEGKELSIDFVSRSLGHSPQKVQFPGKNAQEATKFTRILLILQLAHDALVSGITLTKRHIFYQHQELFATQRTVDELVDNLAIALGVHRDDLNIVASSKGVFAGPISIRLKDNTWIGPATGDALMRLHYPRIPILVLTDYDPDGLNIFRCYRLKSDFAAPGTVNTAPGISWLGIKSQHLLERESCPDMWITPPSEISQPANSQSSEESADSKPSISSTDCREPISALSARDRKVAVGMLEKLVDSEGDIQAIELRRELQVMLMMGIKAEIQWLDEAGNLAEWLGFELGRMLSVA